MAQCALAIYAFYMKHKDTNARVQLNSLLGGIDMLTQIETFCTNSKNMGMQSDESVRTTFSVESFQTEGRMVWGTIEKGDYRQLRSIKNVATGLEEGRIRLDQTAPLPYHFFIVIPEGETRGYAVFQRLGNVGIKTEFVRQLKESLQPFKREYAFELEPLVTQTFVRGLIEHGNIGEVKLISRQIPRNFARFRVKGYRESEISVEIKFVGRRGSSVPVRDAALAILSERGSVASELVTVPGFIYEKAKMQITRDGKPWTIDLSNVNQMHPYFIVDDKIVYGKDGHPTPESVRAAAEELIGELESQSRRERELS